MREVVLDAHAALSASLSLALHDAGFRSDTVSHVGLSVAETRVTLSGGCSLCQEKETLAEWSGPNLTIPLRFADALGRVAEFNARHEAIHRERLDSFVVGGGAIKRRGKK